MENTYKYHHRDISWLSFNKRVLLEAKNVEVPIYERVKFLSIYSSNLDEFFRVRVANLRRLKQLEKKEVKETLGIKPKKILKKIYSEVENQLELFGQTYSEINKGLKQEGIVIYGNEEYLPQHQKHATKLFYNQILGFLQPIIFEEGDTFPFLENGQLYFFVSIFMEANPDVARRYAILNIPSDTTNRFVSLPEQDGKFYFTLIDDIIRQNLGYVFPSYTIETCHSIKLNRDADLSIEDEYTGDLVEKIKSQLGVREKGSPSRFLYDSAMPIPLVEILMKGYQLERDDLTAGGRYHNFDDFMGLPNPVGPKLNDPPMPPIEVQELDAEKRLFEAIARKDYLLHFPYQSYEYVVRFFNEAAIDPSVKSIWLTIYRVAANSFIANALISAAKNGKKVTCFVEVKARFDEANNLKWARKMEESGVRIIYSMPGLKVHAKVALIEKQVEGKLQRIAFLGTGNFNESTAKIYADHGLFTANQSLTKELREVFSFLVGKTELPQLSTLLVARSNLLEQMLEHLDNEIRLQKEGKGGSCIIKINNLEEKVMIDKLYEASEAGVNITLIVRGICCLIPDRPYSQNIKVIRIVDRLLEHARIFYFNNEGNPKLFMGSADWMKRNLFKRIEVVFPILEPELREEVMALIHFQINDSVKAVWLNEDLRNREPEKTESEQGSIRSQMAFYDYLKSK